MHAEAHEWVARHATSEPVTVLDIGGRNINGTVRNLFSGATVYTVLDIADGQGVDIVADASTWTPDQQYDVVVTAETFEHTDVWPKICATAAAALKLGGRFIATMAGPGRPAHSAVDGGPTLYPGEYYGNVEPDDLRAVLAGCGFTDVVIDQQRQPADVRCVATKPEDTDGAG